MFITGLKERVVLVISPQRRNAQATPRLPATLTQRMASWVHESPSELVPSFTLSATAKFSVLEVAVAPGNSTPVAAMEGVKSADVVVMTDASPKESRDSKGGKGGGKQKGAAAAAGGKGGDGSSGGAAQGTPAKKGGDRENTEEKVQ